MTQHTIVAHFDTRPDAERAQEALVADGIDPSSVALLPEEGSTHTRPAPDEARDGHRDEGGFWASLSGLLLPDEDRHAFAEGMSRGGVTLTVAADEAQHDHVADILERHGAVDMDERQAEWRSAGWTGHALEKAHGDAARSTTATEAGRVEEQIVPVVEERLRVGKRVVDRGRVRVRAYTVETPVEERVELRSERARVEHRPVVKRTVTGAEAEALFQERSVEIEEHGEEAVVSKEVELLEEVVVRKTAEDRVETVSDTVRRTEVEVDDDRDAGRDAARAREVQPAAE